MSTALSTWFRDPTTPPEELVDQMRSLGATALALDGTVALDYLAALTPLLRRNGLPVVALEAPLGRAPGRRPARLATEDRDERRAALEAAAVALRAAGDLGARVLVVRLGALDLVHDWDRLVRAFGRATLSDEVQRRAEDRVRLSARALDLARHGLEPLIERAAATGVTVGLANRARWFEIPDDLELGVLLEDFRGAPLAPWLDVAAAHARESLGFARTGELARTYGSRTVGAWLGDACGLRGGLPLGRGEVDLAAATSALPQAALRVVHIAPGATDVELAESLAAVALSPRG